MNPNMSNLNDSQKRRLFNSLFAVLILLAAFLGAETFNALKENDYIGRSSDISNVISISGTGEVKAVPDIATFSFSVVVDDKTVAAAQDTASKKINAIIDAVKGMGVDDKDIQTSGYNSYPTYEYSNSVCPQVYQTSGSGSNGSSVSSSMPIYCPPGKQVLTGYEVSQTITVKVRKTDTAGSILTKVGSLGATNISGINLTIDNMDAVQAQARDKAIQDAKAKASVLAKSLGVRLDKIVNFSESGNYPPIYYAMGAKADSTAGGAPTPPQIPTGENTITSNVTITYEIN